MYRTSPRFPPVHLFFFGVQNHFFFCAAKEKVVLAPAGQAKNQLQDKTPPLKEKAAPPQGTRLIVRRPSRATSAHPFRNHPPRRRKYQRTRYQYSTHSTAVAQKVPRVVQTQAAENRRTPQSLSPKGYHNSITPTSGCSVARNHFHWSTFSFSESRTTFSFESKEKVVLAPAGQAKNQLQGKIPRFPAKGKVVFLTRAMPHPIRQPSRQGLGYGPGWTSGKQSPAGQAPPQTQSHSTTSHPNDPNPHNKGGGPTSAPFSHSSSFGLSSGPSATGPAS